MDYDFSKDYKVWSLDTALPEQHFHLSDVNNPRYGSTIEAGY